MPVLKKMHCKLNSCSFQASILWCSLSLTNSYKQNHTGVKNKTIGWAFNLSVKKPMVYIRIPGFISQTQLLTLASSYHRSSETSIVIQITRSQHGLGQQTVLPSPTLNWAINQEMSLLIALFASQINIFPKKNFQKYDACDLGIIFQTIIAQSNVSGNTSPFELSFVHGRNKDLISFFHICQFFQHHLLTLLSNQKFTASLWKIDLSKMSGFISELSMLCCQSMPQFLYQYPGIS